MLCGDDEGKLCGDDEGMICEDDEGKLCGDYEGMLCGDDEGKLCGDDEGMLCEDDEGNLCGDDEGVLCAQRGDDREMIIIIIMYIYHALINAPSAHMIHINLNMIFYTHDDVKHNPTKTICIKYY